MTRTVVFETPNGEQCRLQVQALPGEGPPAILQAAGIDLRLRVARS